MTYLSKQVPAFSHLSHYMSGNDVSIVAFLLQQVSFFPSPNNAHLQSFLSWIQEVAPEQKVPVCWETEKELSKCNDRRTAVSYIYSSPSLPLGPVGKALHQLLVIQAFRPDRLMAMATIFITVAMGEAFQQQANVLDLAVIVENEVSILCCANMVTSLLLSALVPDKSKYSSGVEFSDWVRCQWPCG